MKFDWNVRARAKASEASISDTVKDVTTEFQETLQSYLDQTPGGIVALKFDGNVVYVQRGDEAPLRIEFDYDEDSELIGAVMTRSDEAESRIRLVGSAEIMDHVLDYIDA